MRATMEIRVRVVSCLDVRLVNNTDRQTEIVVGISFSVNTRPRVQLSAVWMSAIRL